jgi:hypothetical protein
MEESKVAYFAPKRPYEDRDENSSFNDAPASRSMNAFAATKWGTCRGDSS